MRESLVRVLGTLSLVVLFAGLAQAQVVITTSPSPLPTGKLGASYLATLNAHNALGETLPYRWDIVAGSLPPGLSLSTGGVISGTPTTITGTISFTVRASDSGGNPPGTKDLTIDIAPSITTTSLPSGGIGRFYSQTLTAIPTTDAIRIWSVSAGSLPPGLTMDGTGVISGTPTTAGTSNFTILLTDCVDAGGGICAPGTTETNSQALSITVQPPLTISTTSLPPGIVGVFYAQQLAAAGPSPVTWSVTSGVLPLGLSLAQNGTVSGTPTLAGSFSFTVQAASTNPPQTAQQSFIVVINAALTITTSTLPGGTVGVAYPITPLVAAGGRPPYTWSIIGGTLSPGLTFSADGILSGTPTVPGTSTFTVQVADTTDGVNATQFATHVYTLIVANALTITTSSLPNGSVGTPYSQTLSVTAGTAPFTWSVSSGSLPAGLGLSSGGSTGVSGGGGTISGTPTAAGTANFAVTVTDSSNPQQTTSKALSITIITPTLTITTASPLPPAVVGVFYLQQFAASGPSPQTWSVISGLLPPGLTLSATGTLSGNPVTAAAFDFTVQATGGATGSDPQQTATMAFHLVVNAALTVRATTLPDGSLGVAYPSTTLTATGGLAPYTWANLTPLPPGLSLSSAGVITGTPASPGNFTFTAQVSDSFNPQQQASRNFSLVVTTTVTITTATLPNAIQNVVYSQQLQATGTAPLSWAVSSGVLPVGLNLSAAGLLQGTPTVAGAQTFSVSVSDARASTSTQSFTLTVDPPIAALSVDALPASLNPTQLFNIVLALAAPHPSDLSGMLKLAFTSTADVPSDDPATQFSTGSRSVSFTIPANTTTAMFTSPLKLLIGTVTGTVTLTANFDNGQSGVAVATVNVLAPAPQITNVTAVRTGAGVDVQITGYAASRRVTTASFAFTVKNGSGTQQVPLSRSVDPDFNAWYRSVNSVPFGSSFSFVQSFIGDPASIQDVTVSLANAQGSTTFAKVKLP